MPEKQKAAAREALAKEITCASACAHAMEILLDQAWLLWEPETLWLELNHMGVDVPLGNRGQIMAARSLFSTGRFWYDAHAYAATCIAFNNEEAVHVSIEDAPVVYMNWAAYEASTIIKDLGDGDTPPAFEHEAVAYTAVQLVREGFAIAPKYLDFADHELSRLYPKENSKLRDQVRAGWASAPKTASLMEAPFPESAPGVQLARLAAVQAYFDMREQRRNKQLLALKAAE